MPVVGNILFSLSVVCVAIAAVFGRILFIFKKRPEKVGKTLAFLKDTKHRKNVRLRGGRILKDVTVATYQYKVDEKSYKKRDVWHIVQGKLSKMKSVIYLKKHPQIADIKGNGERYVSHIVVCVAFSLLLLLFGISFYTL